MTTMKRIQHHRYGGPEVLRLEDFEPRRPGPCEVLVRVRAAGAFAEMVVAEGGCTRSVNDYSRGSSMVPLPHLIGAGDS
jgi:NADPH:quinone reductase-like Zn-dependent oxidoreductase